MIDYANTYRSQIKNGLLNAPKIIFKPINTYKQGVKNKWKKEKNMIYLCAQ